MPFFLARRILRGRFWKGTKNMKVTSWILGIAALALALATEVRMPKMFGEIAEAATSQPEVNIDNYTFAPATITVPAGTTVHWVNHDEIPHNVVADDKSFKSKVMDTNEDFTFTFSKPGTYNYSCSIHPRMTGKVVVQ